MLTARWIARKTGLVWSHLQFTHSLLPKALADGPPVAPRQNHANAAELGAAGAPTGDLDSDKDKPATRPALAALGWGLSR